MAEKGSPQRRGWSRGRLLAAVATGAALCSLAAAAWAELGFGLTVNEGVSVMGGPVRPHMASPDGVTGASIDAITTASRVAHGGGAIFHLRRGGSGSLDLGLEYIHYRFDMDYQFGRASMEVVGLRVLALARLVPVRLRGVPVVTFGFGAYLELTLYSEAVLSGSWINLDVASAGFGLTFDLIIQPYRFALSGDRGHLTPGIYARAYRGVLSQLEDELGSEAPLASIAVGVSLRYDFPD